MGDLIKNVVPYIAAAATGGIPALIAMAAEAVGSALGVKVDKSPDAINKAIKDATPEQLIALQKAEQDFKVQMQAMGFKHEADMAQLNLDEQKTYVSDTQDARKNFATNDNVFTLGVVILMTFAFTSAIAIWGCYILLVNGIQTKDAGIVAAIFTFLGTIIGYLGANAQQVVGYFFGTSAGSKQKTDMLADAISSLGQTKK